MSDTPLPLDEALTLRARVAELEANNEGSLKAATYWKEQHDRAAKRVAELERELAEARSGALAQRAVVVCNDLVRLDKERVEWMARANALRDALEDAHARLASPRAKLFPNAYLLDHAAGENVASCGICAALAAHPAASLAAHDAEVARRAFKVAADECRSVVDNRSLAAGQTLVTHPVAARCAGLIEALAAQEVKP